MHPLPSLFPIPSPIHSLTRNTISALLSPCRRTKGSTAAASDDDAPSSPSPSPSRSNETEEEEGEGEERMEGKEKVI